eukprot:161223-Chlamydomonas_euryale.AAC.1
MSRGRVHVAVTAFLSRDRVRVIARAVGLPVHDARRHVALCGLPEQGQGADGPRHDTLSPRCWALPRAARLLGGPHAGV